MSLPINKIIQGDTLQILKTFHSNSIDMVMTSPPYWALRDYGVEGQIGLEADFNEYLKKLVSIFDEVKRVLKKTGTCWVNLGDVFGGSGMGTWSNHEPTGKQVYVLPFGQNKSSKLRNTSLEKSMLLIPERFALRMIDNGWILRNKIVWFKPNHMPSSVKDRFSNSWEYLFFFTKSKNYYFDSDAIREPRKYPADVIRRIRQDKLADVKPFSKGTLESRHYNGKITKDENFEALGSPRARELRKIQIGQANWDYGWSKYRDKYLEQGWKSNNGKIPDDLWSISTQPFSESHFAVFPEKLCEIPIKAGCPQWICKSCGMPKREEKIIPSNPNVESIRVRNLKEGRIKGSDRTATKWKVKEYQEREYVSTKRRFVQWGCNCDARFDNGIVLDPFSGSGTACLVAKRLNRNFIGIDLKPEYVEMARKRLDNIPQRLEVFTKR